MKTLHRSFMLLSILVLKTSYLVAQFQTGGFEFEGEQREYIVFLPKDYTEGTNSPLVIYLHSYGGTGQSEINFTLLHQVADTANFMVVYPSAIPNWNSGIADNTRWPTPDANDVGFIDALIDTLNTHYSIDLKKVYACGFSNGGFMSYKLACELSHRIAAIASVSGVTSVSTATNCNPSHSMPVLQIHGTEDIWVPINGASGWNSVDQTLSQWTDFNNCLQTDTTALADLDSTDNTTVEKITYTDCSNNSQVVYFKVINGGHSWPGSTIHWNGEGNYNMDINAGVEIWKFFKNFENPITSVADDLANLPAEFELFQNYPNPFNPTTIISYQLPVSSDVELSIFNLLGQKVATLVSEKQPVGSHKVEWDATGFVGGVYLYQIKAGGFEQVKKLLLLK